MNKLTTLLFQKTDALKTLWYTAAIALLFASCGDKDNTPKLDKTKPVYTGNLIWHGGKESRNLPIYNQDWELLDYNIGDTAQVIYDHWKIELLDLHGWEKNWYQVGGNNTWQNDYAQTIEDIVITEKKIQYEPINTPSK